MIHVDLKVLRDLVSAIDRLSMLAGTHVFKSIGPSSGSFCAEPGLQTLAVGHGLVLAGPRGSAVETWNSLAIWLSWAADTMAQTHSLIAAAEDANTVAFGGQSVLGAPSSPAFPAKPDAPFTPFGFIPPVGQWLGEMDLQISALSAANDASVLQMEAKWHELSRTAMIVADDLRQVVGTLNSSNYGLWVDSASATLARISDQAQQLSENSMTMAHTVRRITEVRSSALTALKAISEQTKVAEVAAPTAEAKLAARAAGNAEAAAYVAGPYQVELQSAIPTITELIPSPQAATEGASGADISTDEAIVTPQNAVTAPASLAATTSGAMAGSPSQTTTSIVGTSVDQGAAAFAAGPSHSVVNPPVHSQGLGLSGRSGAGATGTQAQIGRRLGDRAVIVNGVVRRNPEWSPNTAGEGTVKSRGTYTPYEGRQFNSGAGTDVGARNTAGLNPGLGTGTGAGGGQYAGVPPRFGLGHGAGNATGAHGAAGTGNSSGAAGSSDGHRTTSGLGGPEHTPRIGHGGQHSHAGGSHAGSGYSDNGHSGSSRPGGGHTGYGHSAGQSGPGHGPGNMIGHSHEHAATGAHGHPGEMPLARAGGMGRRQEDEQQQETPKWTTTEFMAEQNRKQLIGKLPPVWPAVIDKNVLS